MQSPGKNLFLIRLIMDSVAFQALAVWGANMAHLERTSLASSRALIVLSLRFNFYEFLV